MRLPASRWAANAHFNGGGKREIGLFAGIASEFEPSAGLPYVKEAEERFHARSGGAHH
jgi:hypothetical protein